MAIVKDKKKQKNTIESLSTFKSTRAQVDATLNVLAAMPGRKIEDKKSGRCTAMLHELLPKHIAEANKTAFGRVLQRMEDEGWIVRVKNQKKVYSIELVKEPDDWSPTIYPWLEQRVTVSGNGEVPKQEKELEPEEDEKITHLTGPDATEPSLEEESKEGGIRAGRLASRLERLETSIASQVEDAVSAGISGFFAQLAVSLGYEKQSDEDEAVVTDLTERLTQAQQQIMGLQDDLRAERISNSNGREELNRALRKQYATRDTSPVQASELSEAWRSLARHAIANGWTLHRAGGGHIMWKSPTGFRYFSSSTSSDYRSVRNARADMEKEGLPKE